MVDSMKNKVVVSVPKGAGVFDSMIIAHIGKELTNFCSEAITDLNQFGDCGDWEMSVEVVFTRKEVQEDGGNK